jgi:hypothetical protein
MSADDRTALSGAIAGMIADACADRNDGIAWAAERSVQTDTAWRIIGEILDPEIAGAQKRGAVKALRWLADDLTRTPADPSTRDLAAAIRADARLIESGEATL